MSLNIQEKQPGSSFSATEFNQIINEINNKVDVDLIDQINGIPSLDSSGKLLDSTTPQSILDRLTNLEYIPISISNFTNNINNVELGNTITSITFNYTLNKIPNSLSINNNIGNLILNSNSTTKTVNITNSITYVLTAYDGRNTITANTSINFYNKIYYGTNQNNILNNSQILSLQNNILTPNKNRTINIDGEGKYIYYCYPASMGNAVFTINGLLSTAWTKTTINVTNTFGNVTSYYVYVTNTIQNGTGISITIS